MAAMAMTAAAIQNEAACPERVKRNSWAGGITRGAIMEGMHDFVFQIICH
jgi:hypothetical protein